MEEWMKEKRKRKATPTSSDNELMPETGLLNLQITQYGTDKEGKLALVLDGFTSQDQVDFVLKQFNKFMRDNATELQQ